jgi:glycosyltransferase involved in cell wall biosynthesis/RimJ/RimL family protein N-acetyltransferase
MIIGKNIDLREVEVDDAEFILSLRLDPELNKHLSDVEDDLDKQKEWIKKSKLNKQEWYFIVQNKMQEPVGTIRIYDIKGDSFCWGSWIILPKARQYSTFESMFLLYQFAFFDLGFKQTNFDVRKSNDIAFNFYVRFGAVVTDETEIDYLLQYTKEQFLNKKNEYLKILTDITQKTLVQNNTPLVSIAIITYNSGKFIANAINSVLSQDYPNVEIVISDDSSTDNTLEIVNEYVKLLNKIKVLTTDNNLGATGNWFKCVSNCQGKYVIGLGGDDEFLPSIISEQVTIMEHDKNIAICYSDAVVYDVMAQKELYRLSDKAPTKSGSVEVALQDAIYYSPTMMFHRNLIPQKNMFVGIRHGSDLAFYKELMILSAPTGKIYYLPKTLYKYQKHNRNITVTETNYRREHIDCIKILQNKYPQYRSLLEPSIYDFCCVAFFKSLVKLNFRNSFYFLSSGLKASNYNLLKFFRALLWGIKFYLKFFFQKFY